MRRLSGRVRLANICAFAPLFILSIFAGGCGQKEAAANPSFQAVPVKTEVVEPVPIPETSDYLATLKSRHSTVLNPQVEGQITNIFVKSGDHVKAGMPIMQIDPLQQQALVGSQEAARAAQMANVEYARTQWEREQKLYEAGVVARQEYDQAKTNLDTAEQQLKSLDQQVEAQQVLLHYYKVVAPTDGIVGDVPVRVGDRVTTSTLLTTIDDRGALQLYINVPVERSKDLKPGQTVQIISDDGKVVAESRIDFISPEVDNSTQSILAKATFENKSGALRTSQFAQARITWSVRQGLVIPVLAVTRINGQFFAFVAQHNGNMTVAHQQILQVGDMVGSVYSVLGGLKAGDHVIVEGTQILGNGMPVSETPATSSSNSNQTTTGTPSS
jgi:RND family efflux transporter MFP subunit